MYAGIVPVDPWYCSLAAASFCTPSLLRLRARRLHPRRVLAVRAGCRPAAAALCLAVVAATPTSPSTSATKPVPRTATAPVLLDLTSIPEDGRGGVHVKRQRQKACVCLCEWCVHFLYGPR